MKRLLLLLLAPLCALGVTRSVSISAPSQVTAGQSFLVPTSASTDASDGEQIGFYHAEYSTNNGASWTGFCYDVNVGSSATRNAWITAGGAGSTILVRVRIAFRGGGAGDVDYNGSGIDWGGSWDGWQVPPCKYATINVVAPPNQAPTVTWVQNPAYSYVNQWFTMQARGNDADGNLMSIWVWKEGVPFAVNGGGNGYQSYSDANAAVGTIPQWINFQAQVFDTANASSAVIYHSVEIRNRAPGPLTLTLSGTTVQLDSNGIYSMWTDNALTATSNLKDPDGNLVNHTLRYQKVTGSAPVEGSWIILGNGTPSNGYDSTKQSTLTTLSPGRWDFNSFGHDGYLSNPGDSKTIWVYGPTNGAQFVSQSVSTAAMEVGSTRSVSITFKNSGDKPWSSDSTPHKLGSQNSADNTRWGFSRVALVAGETIVPTASKTFTFTITAPSTPGTYNFQWQMIEEGNGFFGDLSTNVQIPVVDTTAPSAPTNLQSPSKSATTITLTWIASTDNSGTIAGYRIYRNGVEVGTSSSATYTDTGLTANTSYSYSVKAYDSVPNLSAASNTLAVTTNSDPNADDDADGMSNAWEQQYFGSTTGGDPKADPDYDGLSNVAEYNLGRNPLVYDQGTSTLGNAIPAGWPNADANPSVAVGATSGTLQVDKNGVANYSVPLWVTPGTAGMQPQLSLNYSSQSGAGWLGYGWSLGGVSAITRGGRTLAIDGVNRGISYTADDRFYMDGQRLIYKEGTGSGYGTNGAEYRTEIDSISKIVSYGSAGTGPMYFKVWTKAGLIIEFGDGGNNSAASAEAQGRSEIATWAVSKISDTKGNYMTFDYYEDSTNGEHRLTRINYTGNTGVSPYASVRLTYEARPDTFTGYSVGSKVSRTQRIKRIGTYYGETLAREYYFDYIERANTGRSILTAIHEKGSDGKEYPALSFNYETPTAGWNQPDNNKWGAPAPIVEKDASPRGTGFIDLNGDGRPDFVRYHTWPSGVERDAWINDPAAGWQVADGSVLGVADWRLPYPLAADGTADNGNRFLDFNGDGLPDFMAQLGGSVVFYRNTGAGFTTDDAWKLPVAPQPTHYEPGYVLRLEKPTLVDLDGDGRVDLTAKAYWRYFPQDEIYGIINQNGFLAWLNRGDHWELASYYAPPFDVDKGARFVDVNGDGLVDQVQNWYGDYKYYQGVALNVGIGWNIIVTNQNASNALTVSSTGPTRFLPPTLMNTADPDYGNNSPVGTEMVDINGDGLVDLVRNNDGGTDYANVAYLNTGDGWIAAPSSLLSPRPLSTNHDSTGAAMLDINGDGIVDVVQGHLSLGFYTYLGTGNGWSTSSISSHNIVRQMTQGGLPNTGTDFVDLNGDGVVDQIWNLNWGGSITKGAAFNTSRGSDRLISVTNGFGVTASIAYAPLTERDGSGNYTVYTKGIGGPADSVNVIAPMYVVKTVTHDDGVGGQYTLNYRYGELRSHRLRGSLGFGSMDVIDSRTGIVSSTDFSQQYPFIGMPVHSETVAGSVTLSESTITYDEVPGMMAGTHLPYAKTTVETTRELDGNVIASTTTSITDIDIYGNVKAMSVSTSDGFTKTTTNTYDNDTLSWILGRLRTASVTSTGPAGYATVTRNSSYTYQPTSGLLETETVEPGDATLALTTTYDYDSFGNKKSVTVSGAGISVDNNGNVTTSGTVSRTTTTQYDNNGRFPIWTENALHHRENYTEYNQALGVLTAMTGANDLPTSWQYDGFGRKIKEIRADNTVTDIRYKWAASGAPAGSLYLVETESTGAPPSLAFYDKFGRAFQSLGINGDGRIVYQATSYDSMGRAYAKSNPYLSGDIVYWTQTTEFDLLNRPKTVTTPDDQNGTQTTTYVYAGLTTRATDPKNHVSRTVKNSQGWTLVNVRNDTAIGGTPSSTVSYYYDAAGNLTSTVAEGVTTSLAYDNRGRKISMADPDMGTWQYRYNIFGELIWQKDAKGQIVTMDYDALGRMTTRVEPEGTTTWTYDTATRKNISGTVVGVWKGKLASATAPGGYSETYTYDSYGRPLSSARTIDGSTYTVETTYDPVGRPLRTKYPVSLAGVEAFSTRNVYNQFGYLKEIRNWLDSDTGLPNSALQGLVYWRVADGSSSPAYNAAGTIEAEEYGNGLANDRYYSRATGRLLTARIDAGRVTAAPYAVQYLDYAYDAVGNVTRRNEQAPGFERDERFEDYDALDRLRSSRIEGVANSTVTVAFDAKGNITSKSDVGSYSYNYTPVNRTNALPHAVSSAGVNSYTYDAVGNMLTGAGRDFGWTSFNQMRYVKNSGGLSSEFFFGAGHERVKQIRRTGTTVSNGVLSGTTTDTTIYVGALYEKVTTAATNTVEHKHYILAPTGRIAVLTRSTVNGTVQANTTRYFHTDGLGSITVVSDEAGRVLKRYTYDAWGKQSTRYTNTGSGITNQAPTTRGFTDHEMLSDFGLIHMNGRVYDPLLGRFLSADPNIDGVEDAQGYNRYSYVQNNPLGATDPTGFFSLKDALKLVAVVVVAWVTAGAALYAYAGLTGSTFVGGFAGALASVGTAAGWSGGWAIAAGVGAGFGSSFASSLLNGGSIGDAFKAGLIGGLVGGISAGIAGKIGDAFGGYGEHGAAGEFGRALAHGASQGALTEAQGGEFRHGFYTGFAASAAAGPIRTAMPDSMTGRTVAAAVVGGTASALGGGKFANGAVSGAFTHLFNDEAHSWWDDAKDYASAAWQGAKQGYYAWADGLNPFGDFYADMGYYDPKDSALQWSQRFGTVSQVAGSGLLGGGGLYGGARSVFWSGGRSAARMAETLGRPIQKTLWGRIMNAAHGGLRNLVGKPVADKTMAPFWDAASSVYAMNVRGTAQAYILRPGPVWTNVERPLLDLLGKSYRIVP